MKHLFLFLSSVSALFATAQIYNVTTFGAVGNGSTINTAAIQAAIDSCTITGGIVLVPSGTFMTGTIVLKSNVTLQVDGTLKGSGNINDYPDMPMQLLSITNGYQVKTLIFAENQNNLAITGNGTIDGNGISFLGAGQRPFGIRIISCTKVLYQDIRLTNAAFWMMHNLNDDSLTIRNISVANNANSNNDGIGIDGCRNVLIENCTANSLDDALVLKTTGPYACNNVIVRGCTLTTLARAIKIGTETCAGLSNILIENCTVTRGFQDADCGINLAVVDGGYMDNVTVRNITITGVKVAMQLRLGNKGTKYSPAEPTPAVGYIQNVTFKNITITCSTNLTSNITGIPGHLLKNISLDSVYITFPGGAGLAYTTHAVPENETARPNCDIFGDTLPSHGLFIRHVDSISLHRVCFFPQQTDLRPAVYIQDVNYLDTAQVCFSSLVLGIKEEERADNFTVFPNPVSNQLYLSGLLMKEVKRVELNDRYGKTIFQTSDFNPQSPIDFSGIPAGVYLLRVYAPSGMAMRRVVCMNQP